MLASAGAALVVAGFFSDWFDGTAEFAARDFSGFDLARLVRNLQIASSPEDEGELRAAAIVMYLMPALAVNAGLLAWPPVHPLVSGLAAAVAGVYSALVPAVLVVLASTDVTDLGGVLGAPERGLCVSVLGAGVLLAAGLLQFRSRAVVVVRD